MIKGYFESVRKEIEKSEWLIDRINIESESDESDDTGILSGSLVLKDGSVFYFKEVFLEKGRFYRFHYADENNSLICRWDDAPHHKELKTFPHHVHWADSVKESEPVGFIDAFHKIAEMVIRRLEKSMKVNE